MVVLEYTYIAAFAEEPIENRSPVRVHNLSCVRVQLFDILCPARWLLNEPLLF